MIRFASVDAVCHLSLLKGRGQGEGSVHIRSSVTPHLNPLPSNRGEAKTAGAKVASD
jgi:hypothetical protein